MQLPTVDQSDYSILVQARTRYLEEQSRPEADRFVFAYTITISNEGSVPARLVSRHWIITDANGEDREVRGDGVVGEQPRLQPGETYSYTSGSLLQTPIGSMRGTYQMLADDGHRFDARIPPFTLARPGVLH